MGRLLVQKLHPDAQVPTVAYPGEDLGFDIYALEDTFLEPFKQAIVKTGIAAVIEDEVEIDATGYFGGTSRPVMVTRRFGLEVGDRSSMAAKHGIHTMAGKVDYGWRGEIGVVMVLVGTPAKWDLHSEQLRDFHEWADRRGFDEDYKAFLLQQGKHVVRGYQIKAGDKIAQLVPHRIYTTSAIEVVETLPPADRGDNGYGSSGR